MNGDGFAIYEMFYFLMDGWGNCPCRMDSRSYNHHIVRLSNIYDLGYGKDINDPILGPKSKTCLLITVPK